MSEEDSEPDIEEVIADPELAERAADLRDDDTVDFDSTKRQDEGWLKVYVECPDCEVPMARTTVESEDIDHPEFVHSASRSRHRAVCPDCGAMVTHIQIRRVTASTDDIEDAYEAIVQLKDALLDVMRGVTD